MGVGSVPQPPSIRNFLHYAPDGGRVCPTRRWVRSCDVSHRREHLVRCRRELARFARSLMPSPEDASDLLQEVGVVVLASDDAPTDAREFLYWCRGIAHNLARHHWRAARKRNDVFTGLDSSY